MNVVAKIKNPESKLGDETSQKRAKMPNTEFKNVKSSKKGSLFKKTAKIGVKRFKSSFAYDNKFSLNMVFYTVKYNDYRRKVLIALSAIITKNMKENHFNSDQITEIIKRIEGGCFRKALLKADELNNDRNWENLIFVKNYQTVTSRVLTNMDPESQVKSRYLLNRIYNGDIKLKSISKMSSSELCPDKHKERIARIREQMNQTDTLVTYQR
jgi:hypothetical protein